MKPGIFVEKKYKTLDSESKNNDLVLLSYIPNIPSLKVHLVRDGYMYGDISVVESTSV